MALLTAAPPRRRLRPGWDGFRRVAQPLFRWRTRFGFGRVEAAVLAIYCGVLALVIPFHEPWDDEAQAWLIARDNSVWQMIRHRLHYEGAPPLWHLLLRFFHLAHGTYAGIGWFGAVFAVAGIFVLLRWSPFPLIVRVLLPFTFFLQYQYAVIARSYNLFPLLVFGLCALYWRRRHVIWFAIVAGLLANLCMQGIEFATALSTLYLFDLYRERKQGLRVSRRSIGIAVAIYTAFAAVACYTAIPAPDVDFAVTNTVATGKQHQLLVKLIGETPAMHTRPAAPDILPPPGPEPSAPSMFSSPAQWLAWQLNYRDRDAAGNLLPQAGWRSAIEFVVGMASQATFPLSTSNLLACVFLGLLAAWLWSRGSLYLLLPWAALIVVGQVLWVVDHHSGMLLVALLAAIWISAARPPQPQPFAKRDLAFTSVFVVILTLQLAWTGYCIDQDIYSAYDPGRETAAYLIQHPVRRTAAIHFWSVAIQPYFAHNPFFNIPHQYWLWSRNANPDPYYREAVAEHPDRIIYSVEFPGDGQMRNQWIPLNGVPSSADEGTLPWDVLVKYFWAHGYAETHRFCGVRFSRMSSSYKDCDLIFEPTAKAAAPHPLSSAGEQ